MRFWILLALAGMVSNPVHTRSEPWCGSSTPPELCKNHSFSNDVNSSRNTEKEAGFVESVTIKNNSCYAMSGITINGYVQDGRAAHIEAGESFDYNGLNECLRSIEAKSSEGKTWTSHFRACRGRMYSTYTWTLTDDSGSNRAGVLPDDALIVENIPHYDGYGGEIVITSNINCIIIDNLTLNRGNCTKPQQIPKFLKFGQSVKYYYSTPCSKLLEVEISTNQGTDTFTWNK